MANLYPLLWRFLEEVFAREKGCRHSGLSRHQIMDSSPMVAWKCQRIPLPQRKRRSEAGENASHSGAAMTKRMRHIRWGELARRGKTGDEKGYS
jgi:hypothetical protein